MPLDVLPAFFISVLYLAIASVLDVFNNKEIPDTIALLLLLSSLTFSFAIYDGETFIFGLMQAGFLIASGYFLYRSGVMGMADPIFFSVVSLMLPYVPGLPLRIPFIMPVLIYSGVMFAIFSSLYYGYKVLRLGASRINYSALLILLSYAVFLYLSPQLISPVLVVLLGIISVAATFVGLFSEDIKRVMSSSVPVDRAEEEVLAEANKKEVLDIAGSKKVVDREMLERLKEEGIKEVVVYSGMLPFLPFLLAGLVLAFSYSELLFI